MSTLIYSSENSMGVTGLNSLPSSATAGWGSDAVDNTGTIYVGAELAIRLNPQAGTPGASKVFIVYAYGSTNNTNYGDTGASTSGACGTQGSLNFPDVTTTPNNLKRLGVINCLITDIPVQADFNVESVFGGRLPPYWGIAIVNHAGVTLDSTGNSVKWRGITLG